MAKKLKHSSKTATESIQREGNHEEIAIRAYRHWLDRGCPSGSPEEDWFAAEEELHKELVPPFKTPQRISLITPDRKRRAFSV
jgi:hypothetical protein